MVLDGGKAAWGDSLAAFLMIIRKSAWRAGQYSKRSSSACLGELHRKNNMAAAILTVAAKKKARDQRPPLALSRMPHETIKSPNRRALVPDQALERECPDLR